MCLSLERKMLSEISHHLGEIQVTKIDLTWQNNHNPGPDFSTKFGSTVTIYNFLGLSFTVYQYNYQYNTVAGR